MLPRLHEALEALYAGESDHGAYVKARRDAIERDTARDALVSIGLGVTPA